MQYYSPRLFIDKATPPWLIFAAALLILLIGIISSLSVLTKIGGFIIGFFILFWLISFWFRYREH
ncbi:hypothetical protein HYZ97_00740 [Candidatus Pacearchaeota archaeon]|nr:hypothetical protein [Candidatus Pacearchaeota archaeon]